MIGRLPFCWRMWTLRSKRAILALGLIGGCAPCMLTPTAALAWGDRGHMVIGLIADQFLAPATRQKVSDILAKDADTLTSPDFASRTIWADRWRDSDRNASKARYLATRTWHYVDIQIDAPDVQSACFGHPALPTGTLASEGPAQACIIDKIDQFLAELAAPDTSEAERLLALKFVLHLMGDLHQPLHVGDRHDRGGNETLVTVVAGRAPQRLHAFWDTTVVRGLGKDPSGIADSLVSAYRDRYGDWSKGDLQSWALDTFGVARSIAYSPETMRTLSTGEANGRPVYELSEAYGVASTEAVRVQLAKAGFRLAASLNRAFN